MKIALRVKTGIFVFAIRRPIAANAGARHASHVIDHSVDVDTHAVSPAATHHVGELRCRSRAALGDAVAHRLIALAPGMTRLHAVLLRR